MFGVTYWVTLIYFCGVTHVRGKTMAIKSDDYKSIPKNANIKIHKKDIRKFWFRFKLKVWDIHKGEYRYKQFSKSYKVKATNHSRADNIKEAQLNFLKFKEETEKKVNGSHDENMTLDELFIQYMETQPFSDGNEKKKKNYDLRIGNSGLTKSSKENIARHKTLREQYNKYKIGHLPIKDIIPHQISTIISKMKEEFHLADKTCKGVLELLNPVFKFALANRYLVINPAEYLTVKVASQKIIIRNPTEKFNCLYNGINELWKDDPFYRAFFLFGFTGRRRGEVLYLKWENVDFKNNCYWIEQGSKNTSSTKNNDKQQFPLPPIIKEALEQILDDRTGYVFKSPITRKPLTGIDRPTNNLKKFTGMHDFTFRQFRNIVVSANAENGVDSIILSGLLGHKDVHTINKYLSLSTMSSGQVGIESMGKILDAEILEEKEPTVEELKKQMEELQNKINNLTDKK
ncbi:MAG: Unknown protein [uncultured Sulfurovum sp.]|uniref:Tyr recombinase domain-containing protein n=1 Tax=uncultured Sulfurovum sp. TaxID=269237 RepID=A0A6S6SCI5_9BACT|nr:MAG: Unknown protein [uncultured Sulfurovum sp.]